MNGTLFFQITASEDINLDDAFTIEKVTNM